ncbi:hypothetical protein CA13_27420 [Planctomycetes bacterium CA13]|uniref:Porin subfamily protein n=1 Tax=Novipirellula herctigrandis TaxID=2527986 RepID=A0A5C5Z357_9BACT|nr:hypothetical protein CA13_27420 [Planctomycetes bacterium CA13]
MALVALITLCFWPPRAGAEEFDGDAAPTVQQLLHEIDAMKEQLRRLEHCNAATQTSQQPLTDQQSAPSSCSVGPGEVGTLECDAQPGPHSGYCCCGCYPCQCPQPEAPCIDCPRITTLNPYFNVNLFGALKADVLFNTARPLSPGTPYLLLPKSPRGLDETTFDTHARQSTLGALLTGPSAGDWQAGGTLLAMFFNDNVLADQYGFLPLLAFGELKNTDWRFAAGLQFDVFNPRLPTVLPFAGLSGSGNSGNAFRGQVRLERYFNPSEDVQWTIQMALSEPIATSIDPLFRLLSEDNGWPNIELRLALGVGAPESDESRPFEFGVSGVVGQLRSTPPAPGNRVISDVWGLGTDFRWKFSESCGVAGEGFVGQTLGTYSGGILQTVNTDTLEGIRSVGGWLEWFCHWTPRLHSHIGYGIDDPIDRDVSLSGPVRNETIFSTLLWDWTQSVRVGLEFTWRETAYQSILRDNEGAGFHTQFQWTF